MTQDRTQATMDVVRDLFKEIDGVFESDTETDAEQAAKLRAPILCLLQIALNEVILVRAALEDLAASQRALVSIQSSMLSSSRGEVLTQSTSDVLRRSTSVW